MKKNFLTFSLGWHFTYGIEFFVGKQPSEDNCLPNLISLSKVHHASDRYTSAVLKFQNAHEKM